MSKFSIALLSALLIFVIAEGARSEELDIPRMRTFIAKQDVDNAYLPPIKIKFKQSGTPEDDISRSETLNLDFNSDGEYIAASFYNATSTANSLIKNNIRLKTRLYANVGSRLKAIAQFSCSKSCETLALSITIMGKSGQVYDQRDMLLARLR